MSQVIVAIHEEIKELLQRAAEAAASREELPAASLSPYTIEVPADRSHGDYAVNAAMTSAKAMRMPPRKIAEALCGYFTPGTYVDRWEIAGPGFINFFVAPRFYADVVLEILEKGNRYGQSDFGQGKKVMVEFVSANPTGPMHIGNARGGALGDCLAGVLTAVGYNVTREFYVNDAGNQIEKFASSLEARYLQIFDPSVEFPEDGYHGADITEHARRFADREGDTYVRVSSQARRQALVDYALPLNIAGLKADLEQYRIYYDVWFLESQLHKDGSIEKLVEDMKARGLIYEKDGALWYEATRFGGEKDEVMIRKNGIPTYFAADIAYHLNKFKTRGFDQVINVWGADHHGHVARLKGAMEAMGVDPQRLHIVLMQMVRLVRDGEAVKVSKRTGKSITLRTLLDEVPVDAARFIFNLREPASHLEFDLDLAVEQTAQNPVSYVQYAHARICSILKRLESQGVMPRACTREELERLDAPEERELIRHLSSLTRLLVDAARDYNPAGVTRFAMETATLFHKFYNACRVQGDDEPLMQARLQLCVASRQVLRNVLDILKIEAPVSM